MRIILPWLAIGGLRDTYDLDLLNDNGITAMLQIAAPVPQEGFETFYLPLEDGVPVTERAFAQSLGFVAAQKSAHHPIMIACAMGISRSATLAIAAVKELEDVSLREALSIVKRAHPDACPHPILWRSLCQRYREEISYQTVLGGDEE